MASKGNMNDAKKYPIGIMQGRLTPSRGRGIQFFPFDNWEEEFRIGQKIDIDEVEFIFDFDRFAENPLWSEEGLKKIKSLIVETGVGVRHICADFFMRRPFFRVSDKDQEDNIKVLRRLIDAAVAIGAVGIEIPLVDNSSIKTIDEENIFIESLSGCLDYAKEAHIAVGLEIDYPPDRFMHLLEKINHSQIRANYDSGNSAGLGYEPYEEIVAIKNFLSNVHIKDRMLHGTTVPLGTGATNFDRLFMGLRDGAYHGSFILQVCRGPDGEEPATIQNQMAFVQSYIDKYLVVS